MSPRLPPILVRFQHPFSPGAREEPEEPDSYGYRPRKSAADALAAARQRCWRSDWVIDLDVRGFFDSVVRTALVKMLQTRIADGSVSRLIGKCLHVGLLDGEEFTRPEISPLS